MDAWSFPDVPTAAGWGMWTPLVFASVCVCVCLCPRSLTLHTGPAPSFLPLPQPPPPFPSFPMSPFYHLVFGLVLPQASFSREPGGDQGE